jgi:hypothetical protein
MVRFAPGSGPHAVAGRERQALSATSSDLSPESAWQLVSDVNRFGDWMTMFGGWRGKVPSTIEEGTRVSSLISSC